MGILLKISILTLAATISSFSTIKSADQEIRNFLAEYEQAILNRDIAFMERVLADDYVYCLRAVRERRTQALE